MSEERYREALEEVKRTLEEGQPAIVCTVWSATSPAETLLDYVTAALPHKEEATPAPVGEQGAVAKGGAEACCRCGHKNLVWCAPSPLWNAVIRGGCINGEPEYEDMVCPNCFMELAEAKGIAEKFRVSAESVHAPLQTVTPSGRIWDEDEWLWRPSPIGRGSGFKTRSGLGSNPRAATNPTTTTTERGRG